ncbi:bifunctional methyltransferase/pyrophosphohydrolase YabN [Paenibacillus sp. CMAA1364]
MSSTITVVGLGSGNPDRITVGIMKLLQNASTVYVRTKEHPVIESFEEWNVSFQSFDEVYERYDSFPDVYHAITNQLVDLARSGEEGTQIVYAVPGHPMVAESTVQLLREYGSIHGIEVEVLGGESFLDEAFTRLGFDPIEGFQLLDAMSLHRNLIQPQLHTLIGQVYDAFTASEVKLSLMEVYPDDYNVIVGHALGVEGQECILHVPLYELDRVEGFGNLSLVYVPRNTEDQLRQRTFERLHEIVGILRSPGGCPWDQEQTHESIRKNLIEETYEVLETIDEDDPEHMQEELGDLLLQILLHSQMEEENGSFNVYDVIQGINDKLIYRHPHVFGDVTAQDAESAITHWDKMKEEENKRKGLDAQRLSVLDGIPRDLPALMKAYKLQKKAAKVGFDWDNIDGVFAKIEEELDELREAIQQDQSHEDQVSELGDLLFAVSNAARFIHSDPEAALSTTNQKFTQRFHFIEAYLAQQGRSVHDSTVEEMEEIWALAKTKTVN